MLRSYSLINFLLIEAITQAAAEKEEGKWVNKMKPNGKNFFRRRRWRWARGNEIQRTNIWVFSSWKLFRRLAFYKGGYNFFLRS